MNYEELKKRAEAATPGPWFPTDWSADYGQNKTTIEAHSPEVILKGSTSIWPNGIRCHRIADTESGDRPVSDAAYIAAASPDVVLKLIAERDALYGALKGVVRVADRATDEFDAARAALALVGGGE